MRIDVALEPIDASAVRSLVHAAEDELDRRYGPDTDRTSLAEDQMVPPRGCFVVARVDGHLAGGVGLRSIGEPGAGLGEIKRLWVRPDLRGRGVALSLMERAEQAARELGLGRLYLETGHLQPEAHAFYERTGWSRVERFPEGAHCHPLGRKYAKDLTTANGAPGADGATG